MPLRPNRLRLGLWLCGLALAPGLQAADAPAPPATPAACVDFYEHVNATWAARTELPPDRARIGSFDQLRMASDQVLDRALARLLAEPQRADTPGLKLLATAYASGLDDAQTERAGLRALQPLLERIAALPDAGTAAALPALLGELTRHRIALPLSAGVGPDTKDVRRNALYLRQSGLGLADREHYWGEDAGALRLRAAYRLHAGRLLQLAGLPHDGATLDALLALEGELARAALAPAQRRDPQATHNRFTLAALHTRAPGLDWAAWLGAAGLSLVPAERELVLDQPAYAATLAQLAQQAPAAAWRSYLQVRLLDELAPWLAPAYRASHFDYHQRAQRGLQQPPSRAEQLIALIGGRTGGEPLAPALGELYVREAFSPRAQQRASQLIEDVREAMRGRIRGLDWMGETTKRQALAKLDAMLPQVGAPAQPADFTGLTLVAGDGAGNQLRIHAWGFAQRAADLGRPVDRARWTTAPHIVNAFAGGLNRIVFPAAILQPPFFDADADDALNYGGIGSVIGHEITHHFDDRGRQFDAVGNLADWWAPEDAAAYRARADRVVALYGGYEPLPGLRINGRQMLGENISDMGGLQIAYDAYQIALERRRRAGATATAATVADDGLTPAQRFFVANAVIWRSKSRPEALENQVRTGQHSPGPFRVRGPMSNLPAFAQAFGCRAGDPMAAAQPVSVW